MNSLYLAFPVSFKGEIMLTIEKDDPREAPESGDKKPTPEKK